ncbi:DNA-directed RNA polymerase subunit beta [Alphaproteobacteria bacterium]|nr:DNA-directed RNA polymerase subunit beta [Alphaproteobacteria bacterium]GHS95574.1 DNA-directed RNA polymerase subunit beta [Alphaproteobacteria bacterium]
MVRSYTERKRFRKSFARVEEVIPPPSLILMQKASFDAFLQAEEVQRKRTRTGLNEVFSTVFPISDNSGRAELQFQAYHLDEPESDENECLRRGLSYASALKVTFRLVVWDIEDRVRSVKDVKEQDVYVGDVPLMTERGTFIINGIERVIVSQMHRSPGVFFDHDHGKTHASGKYLFAARVVPYRGSWLDFEFDSKDLMMVRIDRRRKMLLSTFLMALESDETEKLRVANGGQISSNDIVGMSVEEILRSFYDVISYRKKDKHYVCEFNPDQWKVVRLEFPLVDHATNEILAEAGTKLTPRMINKFKTDGVKEIEVQPEFLYGKYLARDYINEETGEILIEAGTPLTEEALEVLNFLKAGVIETIYNENASVEPYLIQTLLVDKCCNREEALIEFCRLMRPGEPPSVESGASLFKALFFDSDRYDLSSVGRVKLNTRLELTTPDTVRVLQKQDILLIVKTLLDLKDGKGEVDDIDNLGNRRVRCVGELLENQFRMGLLRMERTIRERISSLDIDNAMPHDLVNAKPLISTLREFFGGSQLSQFMDQTNPLSEITHKRRLSALGPGGLSRERAGFEVRDVHPTHYGRICPIETPEGPNIGLINSLAAYAQINKYGFIESPYRKVVNGKVTDEVVYITAMEEWKHTIGQSTDERGDLGADFVTCRRNGEYGIFAKTEVTLVDVSPQQLVSVAAALIPFLENDDASRALMGSNMQRQAVPLLKNKAPLIGTGMERVVAKDSGAVVVARRPGIVDQVDGNRIVVHIEGAAARKEGGVGVDIYPLRKFQGSNMSTCINQKPVVRPGDSIQKGDVIADGPCTDCGELALGRNVQVAFMSWQGYNFEDSIVISERIVKDDVFTSIHIDGFELVARDTKLGNEEITRDIPNVSEELLRNLDETGIVAIGTEVVPGDILVGKVTPKGESPMTPEEKLLRAIFGEKAADVRDSSLRVPPGVAGMVVDVRILSRRGVERDERMLAIERQEVERLAREKDTECTILRRAYFQHVHDFLLGKTVAKGPEKLKSKTVLTNEILSSLGKGSWEQIVVTEEETMKDIGALKEQLEDRTGRLERLFENKVERLRRGDDLPPGVLKLVKVFIASKRKLQPGDKMAGRHGNKGVVSCVVPVEDMPYKEDGTPIDIILNPLGVPSRMNVGQILETHLGAAATALGKRVNEAYQQYCKKQTQLNDLREVVESCYEKAADKKDIKKMTERELLEMANNLRDGVPMATPVFDGATLEDIDEELRKTHLDTSGQIQLYDGLTGEPFDREITVGEIYMLKLHHLVDDKIHARSIGPYSLVTQQPLGGKAQFGGQRFGEMEVWALEAYGAAYTLQEMLTVKSDDVSGRMKVYEGIVRGEDKNEAGIPESFNVLVKELRSLGLNIEFV